MKKLTESDLKEKHSEKYQELENQIREKEQILEGYKKEHGKLEVFFNKVIDNINPVLELPKLYVKPNSFKGSPVIAVAQISDSHMGEVQESNEIEGFNEYNPDICDRRSIDYITRFIEWVDVQRHGYTINECAVLVTGDLISGDIQQLNVTNAFPTPVQCIRAAEILTKQIAFLASKFDKVTVHFLVEDNHSRLTLKPQMKEAGLNSLNYIVGYIAKAYLSTHSNVEFNMYPMYEKVVRVSNRQYLLSHGHGIIGWAGIAYYGVERKVAKESMARMQIIMDDINKSKQVGFHKFVIGHFHVPFDLPLYSCCGSVSGTGAYDHKNGRHAEPSQASWLVSSKWGDFNRINFILK
jgi:hypothetical protein